MTMQIRLALRVEGEFWNAYFARAGTMDGAKLLGSITIAATNRNPKVKAAFQALMQQVLADAIGDVTGAAPSEWDIRPAPDAERAGHNGDHPHDTTRKT